MRFTSPVVGIIVTAVVGLLLLAGCDTNEPVADELPIVRVEIRLIPDSGGLLRVNITGNPDDISGAVTISDSLSLEPNTVYTGQVDVFDSDGQNVTSRLRERAENFQLFYSSGTGSDLTVATTDTESSYGTNEFGADLPVGITFTLSVGDDASRGQTSIRFRMMQFLDRVKSGSPANGTFLADFTLPLFLDVPIPRIPNEPITQTRLTLTRVDMAEAWIVEASNTFGLNLGPTTVPANLTILRCLPNTESGPPTECAAPGFLEPGRITLLPGQYEGTWELSNGETGANLTSVIRNSGNRHSFSYSSNVGPEALVLTDVDSDGFPIGLDFRYTVPENTLAQGGFSAQLVHFDPDQNETKESGISNAPRDFSYRIPMTISQNGLPEYASQMEITLQRDGVAEFSRMVVIGDGGLFGHLITSTSYEVCFIVDDQESCFATDSLVLAAGAKYYGTVKLLDADGGTKIMQEIVEEARFHEFNYEGYLEDLVLVTDLDSNNLPVGFAFEIDAPLETDSGILRIFLEHYGRFAFKEEQPNQTELDLDVHALLSVR